MKRLLFFIFLMCFIAMPALAADTDVKLQKIFIYTIPDDDSENQENPDVFGATENDYLNELPQNGGNSSNGDVIEEIN